MCENCEPTRTGVVKGSGRKIEGRRLDHIFSVRMSPEDFDSLSAAAQRMGLTVSAFIRRSALANAHRLAEQPPAHTCGGVGCRWCDPLGETSVTFASTVVLAS